MTAHKTPRYALKVAELSSRPYYVQEAALIKAIVTGRQWEIDAALAAIDSKAINWNYVDRTQLFKQAAIYNRLPVIKYLVERFRMKADHYNPLIMEAYDAGIMHGHYEIGDYCRTMGAGPTYMLANNQPPRAMYTAMQDGDLKKVTYLLDAAQDDPSHHINRAVCFGTTEIVDFLLSRGADINYTNAGTKTPFVTALQTSRTEMARHLLAKGANPLTSDSDSSDAMTYSIMQNAMDMVVTLITRGVTPTEKHVHEAQQYNPEIADLLKKALPHKSQPTTPSFKK